LGGLEEYIFGEVHREVKIMKKVGNNNKFSECLLPLRIQEII